MYTWIYVHVYECSHIRTYRVHYCKYTQKKKTAVTKRFHELLTPQDIHRLTIISFLKMTIKSETRVEHSDI